MLKKVFGLFLTILVLAFVLAGCNGDTKIATEDDVCQAVFGFIQSNNAEDFSTLLITNNFMKELADGLDDADPKEKSIKAELAMEFDVEKSNGESIASFGKIISDIQGAGLDLSTATYAGVLSVRTRYETDNHKCKAIIFKMVVGEEYYSIGVDVFQTVQSLFIYDSLNERKLVNYKFVLDSPTTNPVVVSAGNGLNVVISFDAEAVNKEGAWIQTVYDGVGGGMYYDSTMESPFKSDIPSKALTKGKHLVEYLLQPSGNSTEGSLATVKLNIVVE